MAKKTLLIITSQASRTAPWKEREVYVEGFANKLEEAQEDLSVKYTTFQDLTFLVKKGELFIRSGFHDLDLKDVDLVHFKNWTANAQEASMIANYLDWNGVSYFNSEVKTGLVYNKIDQMFLLAHNRLPVPNTFFAYRKRLKELVQQNKLPDGFNYPLIMKANDGSKGESNYLIHSADELLKVLADPNENEREFLLQSYIPNHGDYRFLFIGLDDEPIIFLRRAGQDSHLNNTSKGGSAEFVKPESLKPGLVEMAQRAATVFKREIGGVDILVNSENQKAYILEVNGTPALATGFGLDEKLAKFSDFLAQQLDAQEEE